jgi:hypothetical protein
MWEAWTGIDETEERRAEEAARADLPVRRAAFARGYEEIVLALLAGYARRRRAC